MQKKYEKPSIEIDNLFCNSAVANDDLIDQYYESGVSLNDYNIWNDIFGPIN